MVKTLYCGAAQAVFQSDFRLGAVFFIKANVEFPLYLIQTMRKRDYGKMSLELVHRDISDTSTIVVVLAKITLRAWFIAEINVKLEI